MRKWLSLQLPASVIVRLNFWFFLIVANIDIFRCSDFLIFVKTLQNSFNFLINFINVIDSILLYLFWSRLISVWSKILFFKRRRICSGVSARLILRSSALIYSIWGVIFFCVWTKKRLFHFFYTAEKLLLCLVLIKVLPLLLFSLIIRRPWFSLKFVLLLHFLFY
jgi:hypothetical protein